MRYDVKKIRELEVRIAVAGFHAQSIENAEANLSGLWREIAFGNEEKATEFLAQIRSSLTDTETAVQAAMFALSEAEST